MAIRTARRTIVAGAAVALSLLAASCGGTSASPDESIAVALPSTSVDTATTVPTVVTDPLTGLPNTDPSILDRSAMVVKIDNHPRAKPQVGINQADIVFEENVESLTRFAAVFHSQTPSIVGPIRSGRFQDIDLVGSLNRPLFVWSGGNEKVTANIKRSDLINLSFTDAQASGAYDRDDSRPAPHNLFAEAPKLWEFASTLAVEGAGPPPAQFTYRAASDANASTATPVAGAKVSMDGVKVLWEWKSEFGEFARTQDGKELKDSDGTPVSMPNVVVLEVVYSRAYSPAAKTIGGGKAFVFTNGVVYEGTWDRPTRLDPFSLLDASGAPIKLTPGQTFVMVARPDVVAVIDEGTDPDDVKYP
jgi:hypothetical protein